jgi:hypothetical protein
VKELRRDKERSKRKGLSPDRSPDWVGAGTGRRRGGMGISKFEMRKLALLRSVSVNLAELRRVFKVKNFWFMGEIVTDGVGHLRTYGPRGQVKGGRWRVALRRS